MQVSPEALTNRGWYFYAKCNCTSGKINKFRNETYPGFEVWWWPQRMMFSIKNYNLTYLASTHINRLDLELQKLEKR